MSSRGMGLVGHVAWMEDIRNAYNTSVGKPEEKKLPGGHGCRWEDYIRKDLREIRWEVEDWMCLAQDRNQYQTFVNMIMNVQVP